MKAFEVNRGKKTYYKLSSYDPISGITGMESINELIVSRLLNILGVVHLQYQLLHADVLIDDRIYDTYLCSSLDFKEKGDRKITLVDEYDLEKRPGESILEFSDRMGWADRFYQMIVVDFLIINRDRHGANIELIKHKNHDMIPAPLFDHGLSLIYSCHSEQEVEVFDAMADLPVQSFVGSRSLFHNLELIPNDRLPVFRRLDQRDQDYIFNDLEDCLPASYKAKIWEIIWKRWEYYEAFRTH